VTAVPRHGGHSPAAQTAGAMTMPWDEKDIMTLREEFVALALQDGANRRELCRRLKSALRQRTNGCPASNQMV
jgi:hypothetical protein